MAKSCENREITTHKGDGDVIVTFRFGWDGISVPPDCVGPVESIRVQNVGERTWYVHLPASRSQKRITINPAEDRTISGQPLVNLGLEQTQDVNDFVVSLSPDPGVVVPARARGNRNE